MSTNALWVCKKYLVMDVDLTEHRLYRRTLRFLNDLYGAAWVDTFQKRRWMPSGDANILRISLIHEIIQVNGINFAQNLATMQIDSTANGWYSQLRKQGFLSVIKNACDTVSLDWANLSFLNVSLSILAASKGNTCNRNKKLYCIKCETRWFLI